MKGIFVIAALLLFAACDPKVEKNTAQQPADPHAGLDMSQFMETDPAHTHGPSNEVAGITWTPPTGWTEDAPRSMRVATYKSTAAGGDQEGGECAVFFFGGGQGGDIEANIARWEAQFQGAPKSNRETKTVNGVKVIIVRIDGDFLAPSGPMMQSSGTKENFRLLGAIADAPEGTVFFKFTGPAKTMKAEQANFNTLVASIKKM